MPLKTKAVFFDLDGTLLDSLLDITDCVNYSLNLNKLPLRTKEEVRSFLGHGSKYLIEHAVGERCEEDVFQKVYSTFLQRYAVASTNKSKPYPGVIELLDYLKENDIKIGVITNKPEKPTEMILNTYFKGYPDIVYPLKDGVKRKPDPEPVNLAIRDLKLTKEDVFYVGDSLVDKETAENANVRYALMSYGYVDKDVLKKSNPAILLDSILEIKKYL